MSNNKNLFWLIQNFLFNSYPRKAKAIIRDSDKWSGEQIKQYQFLQLKELISYAYKNVPFYNNSFNRAGFRPEMFKQIDDISRIPLLTKDDVRNNLDAMISRTFPKEYLLMDTSGGTTGLPVTFYADKRIFSPVEYVYIESLWRRTGYSFYDRYVVFRGEIIKNDKNTGERRYWYHNRMRNSIVFSAFEMNDEVIPHYIRKIREFKPKFLHCYPSVLYTFANYLLVNNVNDLPPLKGIFLGSETLYSWQRELFQKVFNTRLYTWYGHRERCILAGEQEVPSVYEVFPTYGFAELINQHGQNCNIDGEAGEIVGTSFYNYAFPLIRYNTQDIAEYCSQKTSHRNFMRIKNIKGRIQDFFIDNTGSMITITTSWNAIKAIKDKISAHQFVQNVQGKLTLNIEAVKEISREEIAKVKEDFNERFPNFDLEIKVVKFIQRTTLGKFRYFVQNLDIEFNRYNKELV